MIDLHVHTEHSSDSKSTMASLIHRADELGMKYLAFTDHADYDEISRPDQPPLDIQAYYGDFKDQTERYKGNTQVLFGLELGLLNYNAQKNQNLLDSAPFDFVIGSTHGLYERDISKNPMLKAVEPTLLMVDYYREMWSNLKTFSQIDSLGHMDYIDRFYRTKCEVPSFTKYQMSVEAVLSLIIQKDIALEVNTASIRRGLGYAHPKDDILLLYKRLGGKLLTIGSDAHRVEDLNAGISQTLYHLQELGFESVAVYKNRTPNEIGIVDLLK